MATEQLLIDNATFAKASEQGQRLLTRGPLATSARCESGRIHVELNNGCAFEFPASQAEGLTGASLTELDRIEITAKGLGLYWPDLDADLYVPNLIKGVLGTKQWMSHIGTTGGKAKSSAKAEASRSNGRLGGRPRKINSPA
jgi:hypothetical protein